MYMISSHAFVSKYSTVVLKDNSLSYGRLVVIECSVLTFSEHTVLQFLKNIKVSIVLFSSCDTDIGENASECFLLYANISLHPDYGNTKITFSENYGCCPYQND